MRQPIALLNIVKGMLMMAILFGCSGLSADEAQFSLPPPPANIKSFTSFWIDGQNTVATNMHRQQVENSFSGAPVSILANELPAEGRYFAEYSFDLDSAGTYLVYAAMQRQLVSYSSPAFYKLDDGPLTAIKDSGQRETSWGLSNASTWVVLGEFELEKGMHTLVFQIQERRKMDEKYALLIDSIAGFDMTHQFSAEVASIEAPEECQSGDTLDVTVNMVPGESIPLLFQLRHGTNLVISETFVTDPSEKTFSLPLPLRMGSGLYQLAVTPMLNGTVSGAASRDLRIQAMVEKELLEIGKGGAFDAAGVTGELVSLDEMDPAFPGLSAFELNEDTLSCHFKSACPRENMLVVRLFVDGILYGAEYVAITEGAELIQFPVSARMRALAAGRQARLQAIVPGSSTAEPELVVDYWKDGEQVTLPLPMNYGVYTDRHGIVHPWEINHDCEYIFDGKAYFPVGGMWGSTFLSKTHIDDGAAGKAFLDDVETLHKLLSHGINDVYVNLVRPPQWQINYMVEYLDRVGIEYGYQISGGSGNAIEGFSIVSDPEKGAIIGSLEGRTVTADVPKKIKVTGFLVVPMGEARDGMAELQGQFVRFEDAEGVTVETVVFDLQVSEKPDFRKITFDLPVGYEGISSVFLVPMSVERFHYWDVWSRLHLAKQRIDKVRTISYGPNFRSFIDILVNEEGVFNKAENFRPYFKAINAFYADWLKRKYSSETRLQAKWHCPDLTFDEASVLIPSRFKDAGELASKLILTNPETGKIRLVDLASSMAWLDFMDMLEESLAEKKDEVAHYIKTIHNVPVVAKSVSLSPHGSHISKTYKGIDAMGFEIYRNHGVPALTAAGGNMLQAELSAHTIWRVGTEIGHSANKGNGDVIFFPNYEGMVELCNPLARLRVHGYYFFGIELKGGIWNNHNMLAASKGLEWTARIDQTYASQQVDPVSYGLIFPGGYNWWWPVNRFTALYDTHVTDFPMPQTVLGDTWAYVSDFPVDSASFVIVNCQDAPYSHRYGEEIEALFAETDRPIIYLGNRVDLGVIPAVLSPVIPILACGVEILVLLSQR